MSATRLIYDKCATKQYYNQSTSVGNYFMYNGKYHSKNSCFPEKGLVGNYSASKMYSGNLIDIESNLLGIDHRATLCNCNKYNPKNNKFRNTLHVKSCQFTNYKPIYNQKYNVKPCNF